MNGLDNEMCFIKKNIYVDLYEKGACIYEEETLIILIDNRNAFILW